MRSLKLGKIMGISIELHYTFILLIIAIAVLLGIYYIEIFVPGMLIVFFLFLSVFLHELFHSVVAVAKGTKVKSVTLWPFGGIASIDEMPENAKDEFLIAVAGPLFNFIIAAIIIILWQYIPQIPMPSFNEFFFNFWSFVTTKLAASLLAYPLFAVFWVNIVLGIFNLFFPALPLDGGRVFRSLLAFKFGFVKATIIVTRLSVFLAIFLFIIGFLYGEIMFLIIAFIIYFGSQAEGELVILRETLRGESFARLINKKPAVINGKATIASAVQNMQKANRTEFLVKLAKGYGYVSIGLIEKMPREKWKKAKIQGIAEKLPEVHKSMPMHTVITKLAGKSYPMLPVVEKGRLAGTIEMGAITSLFRLKRLGK